MGETHVSLEETELNFDYKMSHSLVHSSNAHDLYWHRVSSEYMDVWQKEVKSLDTYHLSSSAPTREGLPFHSPNDNINKAFPIIWKLKLNIHSHRNINNITFYWATFLKTTRFSF